MNKRQFIKLGALIPFVLHLPAVKEREITIVGMTPRPITLTVEQLKGIVRTRKAQGQDPIYVYGPSLGTEWLDLAVVLTEKNIDQQLKAYKHPVLHVCRDILEPFNVLVFRSGNTEAHLTHLRRPAFREVTKWAEEGV